MGYSGQERVIKAKTRMFLEKVLLRLLVLKVFSTISSKDATSWRPALLVGNHRY